MAMKPGFYSGWDWLRENFYCVANVSPAECKTTLISKYNKTMQLSFMGNSSNFFPENAVEYVYFLLRTTISRRHLFQARNLTRKESLRINEEFEKASTAVPLTPLLTGERMWFVVGLFPVLCIGILRSLPRISLSSKSEIENSQEISWLFKLRRIFLRVGPSWTHSRDFSDKRRILCIS